nr:polyprotein [Marmot mosavirus]
MASYNFNTTFFYPTPFPTDPVDLLHARLNAQRFRNDIAHVERLCEMFTIPDIRYRGFPNPGSTCWFNCFRQAMILSAHPGLSELYANLDYTEEESREMANDLVRSWQSELWQLGGAVERTTSYRGGLPQAPFHVYLRGEEWELQDYCDDVCNPHFLYPWIQITYKLDGTPQDWPLFDYPSILILRKQDDKTCHVVLAALEDIMDHPYYVVYDDDDVYGMEPEELLWDHFIKNLSDPLSRHVEMYYTGSNILQLSKPVFHPPRTFNPFHHGLKTMWDFQESYDDLVHTHKCPLQMAILHQLIKMNRSFKRGHYTNMYSADKVYRTWWLQPLIGEFSRDTGNHGAATISQCGDVETNPGPIFTLYIMDGIEFADEVLEDLLDLPIEAQGAGMSTPQQGDVSSSNNQGTQNFYYYNNQYQNSVDMSNSQVSSNDASTGETSSGGSGLSNLLNGFTSLASKVGPMMLLDPNVEEDNQQPDRIQQESRGNTQTTTQSSVGTLVAYGRTAVKVPLSSCAQLHNGCCPMDDHTDRVPVRGRVPALLSPRNGTLRQNMDRHYTTRCGWKVQVQMNTSRFHAGCLGVYAVPEFGKFDFNAPGFTAWTNKMWNNGTEQLGDADTTLTGAPESWNVFPHQFLNCRTNTTVDLLLPYLNFVPTSANGYHAPWTIIIMVITPLQISTGAATTVDISMTVAPTAVQYNGLRHSSALTQSAPVQIRENNGQFTTTIPDRSTPAYPLGFCPNRDFMVGRFHNYLEIAQIPTFMTHTISGAVVPYFTANNTRPEDPLLVMDVTLSSTHLTCTVLGCMRLFYAQYRGSLNVDFMFTGAAMVCGKFLISYTPPGAEVPATMEEAMQATFSIWDLGLQSSFQFVVPFISVSDFRYTNSAGTSTLSVDGWLTVWQYTALTYPANTPERSDIVVMVSAGADFCFRNPCDLAAQGLDTAEKGEQESLAAPDQISGKELLSVHQHTDVGFILDRSYFMETVALPNLNPKFHPLTLNGATHSAFLSNNGLYSMGPWLSCITYLKADLEVTLVPRADASASGQTGTGNRDTRLWVKYYPAGAPTPSTLSMENFIRRTAGSPLMVSDYGKPISFEVPYNSPTSAIALAYHGYSDFAKTQLTTHAPGNTFGAIYFGITSSLPNQAVVDVDIYYRFHNVEAYAPRPFYQFLKYTPVTTSRLRAHTLMNDDDVVVRRSANRTADDISQDGDVETNPGPVSPKHSCPQAQGFARILDHMTAGLVSRSHHAIDGVQEAVHSVNSIKQLVDQALSGFKLWSKVIRKMVKYFLQALIVYRTRDPMVAALLGISDMMEDPFDLYQIFKDTLAHVFVTQPPPLVQGINDINAVFNLMKNVDWLVQLVKRVFAWLNQWVEQDKVTPQRQLQTALIELPDIVKSLEQKRSEGNPDLPVNIAKAREIKRLATQLCERRIASYMEELLKAYCHDSGARTEPIVILLKGAPGQGKTVAAEILAQMLSKHMVGYQSVYSMPPDCDHMEEPRRKGLCNILSDGFHDPVRDKAGCHCCKGTAFSSRVIIATTNLGQIRPVTIADPAAVDRRITFTFEVEAVARDQSGRLDMETAVRTDDKYVTGEMLTNSPPCLQKVTNLFSLDLKARDYSTSLLDVFWNCVHKLNEKSTLTNELSRIVAQGNPCCRPMSIPEARIELEQLRAFMESQAVRDRLNRRTEESLSPYQRWFELMDKLYKFLQVSAIILSVVSVVMAIVKFVSFLWSLINPKKDDSPPTEVENNVCEGPYNGTPTPKPRILKKQQAEGPYSGAPAPAPRKLKKAAVQGRPQIRLVRITEDEIAEAQGISARPDFEYSVMIRNTKPIHFLVDNNEVSLTALRVHGDWVVTNRHQLFARGVTKVRIGSVSHPVSDLEVVEFGTKDAKTLDAVLIKFPGLPQCRSLLKHFTDKCPTGPAIGLCNSENYQNMMWQTRIVRTYEGIPTNMGYFPKIMCYSTPTRVGFCGSPIIAEVDGAKKILGIHCAGNGVNGFGTLLTRKMMESVCVEAQGILYGHSKGEAVPMNQKTQIKKSPLFPIWTPDYGTAPLRASDSRILPGYNLDETIFSKHNSDLSSLPPEFEWATKMYAEELFDTIGRDNGPVSIFRAINGDGVTDAMDMNKASGSASLSKELREKTSLKSRKQSRVDRCISQPNACSTTSMSSVTLVTPLLLLFSKMRSVRIRRFRSVEPVRSTVLRFRLPSSVEPRCEAMSKMMEHNGTAIGSAVGCNPDDDWTRFAFELQDKYVFDLDYSGYDATHTSAMFDLLDKYFFTERNGFDTACTHLLLQTLKDSQHVYGDTYFRMRGGLPSGCPATSILNTIINNITLRAALLGVYDANTVDWDSFRMLAYGDDVVYASPQQILPGDLAEWLNKNTCYKLTPANKTSSFPTESRLSDVTFLKRSFTPDADYPYLFHPVMPLENFKTMLSFCRPGTFQEKVQSVALLLQHRGEEDYDAIMDQVKETVPTVKVPSFSRMRAEWLSLFGGC